MGADPTRKSPRRRWIVGAGSALVVLVALVATLTGSATAEQATQPDSVIAGQTSTGRYHSCAINAGALRCWGYNGSGQLGYGNTRTIGDDETPASAGPVDLGAGRTAVAVSAGDVHTCALLDNGAVRCWGFAANGRLGYGNAIAGEAAIGDDESPASVAPVDLGTNRTAKAISAGDGHTCAILDDNSVRCWGYGFDGRLGLNSTDTIGDNETPGSQPPVNFGPGRSAKAVSAGNAHTCAILDDNTVRCWGFAGAGRLGYGTAACLPQGEGGVCPVDVGRGCWFINNLCTFNPAAPATHNMGPVNLGAGRTARAITAGQFHTCAVLDNGSVRCWGTGGSGRLGYGNESTVGAEQTPDTAGPVNLGPGLTAKAITAGGEHTCAILSDDTVKCWGASPYGQLGYGSTLPVGLTNVPADVNPVNLGSGRTARAITVGEQHTCARLDDGNVRCWGRATFGRLGYCNTRHVGDDEAPGSAGPVDLGSGGARCATGGGAQPPTPKPGTYAVDPSVAEQARLNSLRACLSRVRTHARREVRRARRLKGARRARALRHARRHRRQLRRRCLRQHGRTPGQVTGLTAQAAGGRKVLLTFKAPGSDGSNPPAARTYLVKQSRRPIRSSRAFNRARSLCKGRCSFANIKNVGATLRLTITDLRRGRTYYFAVKARDNVSKRTGPRSKTVRARVR